MVVQDGKTRDVLMVGWVNREALARTVQTGFTHFWSRSRGKLWKKGESSGHVQIVKELLVDCDMDTVVALVEPRGAACHAGYGSCFYRRLEPLSLGGSLVACCEREFDPCEVYGDQAAGTRQEDGKGEADAR